jgi:hypothetical protein
MMERLLRWKLFLEKKAFLGNVLSFFMVKKDFFYWISENGKIQFWVFYSEFSSSGVEDTKNFAPVIYKLAQ